MDNINLISIVIMIICIIVCVVGIIIAIMGVSGGNNIFTFVGLSVICLAIIFMIVAGVLYFSPSAASIITIKK